MIKGDEHEGMNHDGMVYGMAVRSCTGKVRFRGVVATTGTRARTFGTTGGQQRRLAKDIAWDMKDRAR